MDKSEEGTGGNPLDAAREMERRERDDKIADELDQTARAADAVAGERDQHVQ